jgi:hypothetical protein
VPKKQVEAVSLFLAVWLRIAFSQFLSSESRGTAKGVASTQTQTTKKLAFCPTTKRLEAFGTMRATCSYPASDVMDAASYTTKERLCRLFGRL